MSRSPLYLAALVGLGGCNATIAPVAVDYAVVPSHDPLYVPQRVTPVRLEYAPDRSTFAPILTERAPYPTQPEAAAAYLRLLADAPPDITAPASVRLFGCKPGTLDEQTARMHRVAGPAVLCATDFLDASGGVLFRQPVNFIYARGLWIMDPLNPPRELVGWRGAEPSPKDIWWWVPFRARYQ